MTRSCGKLLAAYDRGVLTHDGLVYLIVEETTARLTDEFVTTLPTATVEQIREFAMSPRETRWFSVVSYCGGTPESWDAAQREAQTRWLTGLAHWRDYFGFTAENAHDPA